MLNPYDELYSRYDMKNKPYGYPLQYVRWRTKQIRLPWVKYIKKGDYVLDVGGGFGLFGDLLRGSFGYINLDISKEMLKWSKHCNILGEGESLPFKDKSFDCVACSEVLEHVKDKVKVLSECYRVLKDNGMFLLSTPRIGWPNEYWKRRVFLVIAGIGNRFSKGTEGFNPAGVVDVPSDEGWLRSALNGIGFKVITQYRADNHLPWANGGTSKFWMWFADTFIDGREYGHCTVCVSVKK